MSYGIKEPTPVEPEVLTDVFPLFERILRAFGPDETAKLLNKPLSRVLELDTIQVASDRRLVMRILDVHDVYTRALQIFALDTVMMWLVTPEPHLFNAKPVDVLRFRGSGPLIDALKVAFDGMPA